MKFVLYTNCVSAHQLPMAREMASLLGVSEVAYVYENEKAEGNQCIEAKAQWITTDKTVILNCETLLVGGLRPTDLLEKRVMVGLRTFYMSERWFKPPIGVLRLLHPKYFLMAWRIVRLIRNAQAFTYLPIGIHAARDMARLCGLMHGDLRCLFRAPKLEFERKPGGKIWISDGEKESRNVARSKKYCLDKMRMWGYFVEKSEVRHADPHAPTPSLPHSPTHTLQLAPSLRVLWVGRFLNWKCVDTIIRAVGELSTCSTCSTWLRISLDIYGTGPEEKRLKKLAAKYDDVIKFYPPVPIAEVRKLMREHDVYVLSSNGYEGWGAVVSEALEERMVVAGTYEAGSCATILPESCLFHAGDWRALTKLLCDDMPKIGIEEWTAKNASEWMLSEMIGNEGIR